MDLLQQAIQRKLQLFGHICRRDDSRKLKALVFGIKEGTNRRGRPCRERINDIMDWCKSVMHELNISAKDRSTWKDISKRDGWLNERTNEWCIGM